MATPRRYLTFVPTLSYATHFDWWVEGEPVDLTDWSVVLTVRAAAEHATILLEAADPSEPFSGLTVEPLLGRIHWDLTAEQTTELPSMALFDIVVTNPANESFLLVRGTVAAGSHAEPATPRPIYTFQADAPVMLLPGPAGTPGEPGITASVEAPANPHLHQLWLRLPA